MIARATAVTIACSIGAGVLVAGLSVPRCGAQVRSLARVWEYPTKEPFPLSLAVDARGPYVYVALKDGGVAVLENAPGDRPPHELARVRRGELGSLDAMQLLLRSDRLYVALGDHFAPRGSAAGLAILDVRDPRSPRLLGIWRSAEDWRGASGLAVDGIHAYLGAMRQGVAVLDISDPSSIRRLATFLPDVDFPRKNPDRVHHPNARGLTLAGNRLYVAYDAGGLRVLDVSRPEVPREIGRYVNAGMGAKQQAYNNVVVDGTTAYAAVDYAGLEVLDVRDPARIRQLGWWNPWRAESGQNIWVGSAGHTNQLALDAKKRLIYVSAGDSEMQVVDVSDPRNPRLSAEYGKPRDGRGAWGLALGDTAVYLVDIRAVVPFRGDWSGIVAINRE